MRKSLFVTVLFLAACASSPGEGKPRAEVSEPPAAAADVVATPGAGLPVPAITAPSVLKVDAKASRIHVLGAKVTAQHPIIFHKFEGAAGVDGDNLTAVAFAVDVDSLESDDERLTGHLKNEDFLDVPNHPHATFASTAIAAGSTVEGATHTVTGDLTIRGNTRRVSFPATLTVGADKVQARAEFVINRHDFGVTYPGRADDLVKDDVLMTIELTAPRA